VGGDKFGRVQKDIERNWRVTAGYGLDMEATNPSCNADLNFFCELGLSLLGPSWSNIQKLIAPASTDLSLLITLQTILQSGCIRSSWLK
jgi:hypothetical protein